MIGASVQPLEAPPRPRTPDAGDDDEMKSIVLHRCVGLDAHEIRFLQDGMSYRGTHSYDVAGAIFAECEIAFRVPITSDHSIFQLGRALANLYVLVTRTFHHFGIAPRAAARVKLTVPTSSAGTYPGPELASGDSTWTLDVSNGDFVSSVADVAMQVLRIGNISVTRDVLRSGLASAWAAVAAQNEDLQDIWS